ncbi:Integrase core domain protein [Stieleria neptunia]|uniref:Integrase core domain protein n=1 Tax=Stieleria neptunia TaxID=2527979 RepID=A0A518I391_9BACT|nr:IS630 family transposase [Stieleria neptunia]QDV42025.1 Integrase core domain protein [Stieleria neptunia]QDV45327.1 Integrase core domain protein [Stieleria neptunia]QDV45766.1 Integrase core domain protein [Stieleria neptunia]QDV45808.1 Integrase core domain protein [Stieleria neptunia]QDV46098.1 Integrase core domain protein [Stieleria neptunia]
MARPATVFAKITNQQQRDRLIELWKQHPNHYTRIRAHAILLSDAQYEIEQIVDILSVSRDSVRAWIKHFEQDGPDALLDEKRPGGPRKLNEQEEQILKDLLRQFPSRPATVLSRLRTRTGKSISRHSLRRYARRFNLSWKRFRRSLRKKRDEKAFRLAQEELAELLNEPELDVVYFDEAGFSLKGVVPYGWLPIGERTDVPVTGAHGATVQALGFEHQDGTTHTYLHKGYVNTQTVIEIMDDFCETIDQTTVVILDNASCHTSGAFEASIERWAERGLLVYHLPPYSPELNSIERLWRQLKYQQMPATAWERFKTLLQTLTTKLCEIGEVTYMPSLESYAE